MLLFVAAAAIVIPQHLKDTVIDWYLREQEFLYSNSHCML